MDYDVLFAQLDEAPRGVVDVVELLHPHRPAEDAAWPAPRLRVPLQERGVEPRRQLVVRIEGQPVWSLLDRLAAVQMLTCALTAAQMALPHWFGFAEARKLKASQRLSPHVALRNAWRWLAGQYRLTDLLDCAEVLGFAIDAASRQRVAAAVDVGTSVVVHETSATRSGLQAARSVMSAVAAASYLRRDGERDSKTRLWMRNYRSPRDGAVDLCAKAVLYAALVTPLPALIPAPVWAALSTDENPTDAHDAELAELMPEIATVNEFLATWWRRCRCRLAFADAETANIDTIA